MNKTRKRRMSKSRKRRVVLLIVAILITIIWNLTPEEVTAETVTINLDDIEIQMKLETKSQLEYDNAELNRILEITKYKVSIEENRVSQLINDKNGLENSIKGLESTMATMLQNSFAELHEISKYTNEFAKYERRITKYKKADFTIKEFIILSKACEKYNVPVNIMMALIEVESNFSSFATNPKSTATGYGQILNGTGEYLYKLMELKEIYGSYYSDIRFDKEVNINMSVYYIGRLEGLTGSFNGALKRYYGSTSDVENVAYARAVEHKLIY